MLSLQSFGRRAVAAADREDRSDDRARASPSCSTRSSGSATHTAPTHGSGAGARARSGACASCWRSASSSTCDERVLAPGEFDARCSIAIAAREIDPYTRRGRDRRPGADSARADDRTEIEASDESHARSHRHRGRRPRRRAGVLSRRARARGRAARGRAVAARARALHRRRAELRRLELLEATGDDSPIAQIPGQARARAAPRHAARRRHRAPRWRS